MKKRKAWKDGCEGAKFLCAVEVKLDNAEIEGQKSSKA
jgi:hypothetical protein